MAVGHLIMTSELVFLLISLAQCTCKHFDVNCRLMLGFYRVGQCDYAFKIRSGLVHLVQWVKLKYDFKTQIQQRELFFFLKLQLLVVCSRGSIAFIKGIASFLPSCCSPQICDVVR